MEFFAANRRGPRFFGVERVKKGDCSDKLYSLVPTVLIFKAKTNITMNTVANKSHSIRIPLVRCYTWTASFYERQIFRTVSLVDVFQTTTISSCSYLGLTVITLIYPLKECRLLIIFTALPTTSFSKLLRYESLGACVGWTLVKTKIIY